MSEETLQELHNVLMAKNAAVTRATIRLEIEAKSAFLIDKEYLHTVDLANKEFIEALENYNKAVAELEKDKMQPL